jgi:3-hydroxyisobutyrate dehydrogenase-like beta-hydroxyacid dehydrogenase
MTLGFVGLGRMGQPIVRRLLAAGHAVLVHDIVPSSQKNLVADGATAPAGLVELAAQATLLFICVPGPAEVGAVMQTVLFAMQAGGTIVEMSTVSPAMGCDFARAAEARGLHFIDGPISGGVAAARDGALVMMAGGAPACIDAVRPVVNCFAPFLYHLGGPGSGYLAKAINQAIYLSYAAVFCEAAALGAVSGLDVPVLLEVLRRSVSGRPLMTHWEDHIATGDLAPGFQLSRVLKDLAMAQQACDAIGFKADLLEAVVAAFRATADDGHARHDMTALFHRKAAPA